MPTNNRQSAVGKEVQDYLEDAPRQDTQDTSHFLASHHF